VEIEQPDHPIVKPKLDSTDPARETETAWGGMSEMAEASRLGAFVGMMMMMFVMAIFYFVVNEIAAARGVTVFDPTQFFVVVGRTLDSRIPYLPWTVMIYKPLFGAFYWVIIFAYPKTKSGARELFMLYSGVIGVTVVACVVFLLCPVEMTLRVGDEYQDDATRMHAFNQILHGTDRPFNTWPCLHVAQTGLIALVAARWLGQWTVLLWIAWTGLAISTLTTKQHYIWDIVTGIPLALAWWHCKLRQPSTGSFASCRTLKCIL
jgi:hypothetical protein